MNSIRNLSIIIATIVLIAALGPRSKAAESRIDFENDLVPVFTKSGCNAGACHGAALGRGGFKLSLFGGNSMADYEAIVRQRAGRRINLVDPESSLIIQKPTETIEHGGGFRFDYGDEGAERILAWIRQGADNKPLRHLERVKISPERTVTTLGQPTTLQAWALYSDGAKQDVTRWTIFAAEDDSAIEVDPISADAKVLRRGRHLVVARYLNKVMPVELIVPLTDANVDLANQPRWNFIDSEVLNSLAALRLPVSPLIDDATFLRRVTLDLTGRLPTAARVAQFMAETGDPPSPNQLPTQIPATRAALIDELLQSDAFNEYWTYWLAKLLRIRSQANSEMQGATTYHHWLADQLKDNVGYDEMARSVILGLGDTHNNGPANFYRTVKGPREQAELLSELFMGSRLRCANCHNHPLDRWTQDDYHGLAAILAKVESGQIVQLRPGGEVTHPRTLEPALARIPGERFLAEDSEGVADGREALAAWLTDTKNPYFAKAIVNRLWKQVMGRGLVEQTDDFRATNPATHPALLRELAADFQANGHRLRHTLRQIVSSATYARGAHATAENKDDDRFYSHRIRQPLEPEVLADAISDVLGIHETYGNHAVGTRAVALLDPQTPSVSLDALGRCGRKTSCENVDATGDLSQKLHLFNGDLLNARIGHADGRLEKLILNGKTPMEIVDLFYRSGLSRPPTEQEAQFWQQQLSEHRSNDDQRKFLQDFVWGLLTSNDFVTNH